MNYTFPITKDMACAKSMLPISYKYTLFISRNINTLPYPKAKKIIEGMASEKLALKGKFYTKASGHILKLLEVLESNAKAKNLDTEKMKLFISTSKGPTMYRLRRKQMYGKQMRVCNVQVILKKGGKVGTGKEVHK
ncbi:MAG: uL22 family ribosomal protein [Candidatus Aenigmarchaeota archaeon]|nr:uL22 family ribosomal protein [Candidatus Aenigmarchaeota archaeon]